MVIHFELEMLLIEDTVVQWNTDVTCKLLSAHVCMVILDVIPVCTVIPGLSGRVYFTNSFLDI